MGLNLLVGRNRLGGPGIEALGFGFLSFGSHPSVANILLRHSYWGSDRWAQSLVTQCMRAKSLQSDSVRPPSLPGFSVHGIFQT